MSTGRFISEDTHWNPSNMIYGDNEYKKEEIKYPDIISILQATNLYGYCIGNPIVYKDVTGEDLIMDPNLINDSIKSVWFLGAEFYLKKLGYKSSAWLLEHLLESNPSNVYRGNDSNLAQLIKSDEQFINEFNKSFSQLDDNAKYGEFEISFTNNTDLYYSIYNARIEYYIYDIDENVKYIEFYLYDTYDYTQFKLIDEGISFPNFANDMARLSQMLGAINEFDIVVKFNLTIQV